MDALTNLVAPWLVTYLLHSTLLLAGALLAARFVRSPAARDVVWKGALFGGLVTATLQGFVGSGPGVVSLPAAREAIADAGAARVIGLDVATRERGAVDPIQAVPGSAAGEAQPALSVARPGPAVSGDERSTAFAPTRAGWFVLAWFTIAAALALRLGWRAGAMWRLFADRRPLGAPHLRAAAHRLAGRSGLRLSESRRIASPVALGRSEVCMPARALDELEPDEQEAMLAHELAHLQRRDPWWLLAVHALEALLFLQPLNRVVRLRLQDDMEYLCDAWAAQRTARPVPLARCLATVAGWLEGETAPALAPGMAATDSRLVQRVEALFEDMPRGGARLATGATGLALLALACVGPHADQDDEQQLGRPVVRIESDGRILTGGDGEAEQLRDVDELRAWLTAVAERESGATLVIDADDGATFGSLRRVTDLCDEVGLVGWRLEPHGDVFIEDGSRPEIRASIEEVNDEDGSEELGERADGRIVVALAVDGPGTKVHPDGSPWTGQGRFRYDETRKLEYRVGGMKMHSLKDVEIRLGTLRATNPDSAVVIDAEAGIVYRDVVDTLDRIIYAGFTDISFKGAYEQPIVQTAVIDDDGFVVEPADGDEGVEETSYEWETSDDQRGRSVRAAQDSDLAQSAAPGGETRHWLFVNEDGDVRGVDAYDPKAHEQHWRIVRTRLAALAAGMPKKDSESQLFNMSLPDDRLTIHAHPDAQFMHVQKVMEQCGAMDVQIWKIELQRGDGTQAPVIPVYLPRDVGVMAVEEGEDAEPVERIEVLMRQEANGVVRYHVGPVRTTDLEQAIARVLQQIEVRKAVDATAEPVLIDARPGVTAGQVLDVLEPLYAAGLRDYSFVGYYESAREVIEDREDR